MGITAFGAYSVGHQNPPVSYASVAAAVTSPSGFAQSAAPAKANVPDNSARGPDTKRKVDAVLTAAAIAAIIIQVSRDQYHAGGRPCACPDDTARNGSACGGRSAYSRPGGAAPLCYPSDVTAAMIESYRQRQASR